MSDRQRMIDGWILAACTLLAIVFGALGIFVVPSVSLFMAALAGFVLFQGVWTYLHNETLRRDLGR